jgi:hypothetical protein
VKDRRGAIFVFAEILGQPGGGKKRSTIDQTEECKKDARRGPDKSGLAARPGKRGVGCERYLILCSTGIRYFLKVTGFSDIGKCPISSMMMHSELRTFFAVFCVISGVQAKS